MARTRNPRSEAKAAGVKKPISDIAPEEAGMTARTDTRSTPPPDGQAGAQPVRSGDEEVRARAYHRYEERGRRDGLADEDWYEAEKELRSRR